VLGADDLFLLERYLDEQNTVDKRVIDDLNVVLHRIYDLPTYQAWLNEPTKFATQFKLPPGFGAEVPDSSKRLLDRYRFVNGSRLEVKIDKHEGLIHLTDGPWVPASYRVYPFADESTLICTHIRQRGYDQSADLLIDPACGCGHHGQALTAIATRINLDINLRALAFCRINSILHHTPQMLSGLSDLRDGFPKAVNMLKSEDTLVSINMPFAIFPKGGSLPTTLAQDGGDRGVALTFAALRAVKELSEKAQHISNIRLVILFYSLGSHSNGKWSWDVVKRAENIFGDVNVAAHVFDGEPMWRVNGVKSEKSPMPLERMKIKASCAQTFSEDEVDEALDGYEALERLYREHGYTHLGYGLLDISAKSAR
jgi:hypothetical protein